ncbi:hypothetical protein KKA95_02300 [Patescibacteria group bacterium]|nr:hypothetical protein [Patescibacteria group bacterium]
MDFYYTIKKLAFDNKMHEYYISPPNITLKIMTEVIRRDSEQPEQHETEALGIVSKSRPHINSTVDEILEQQRIFAVEYVPPRDEESEESELKPGDYYDQITTAFVD